MKLDSPDYEFPVPGSAWTQRVEDGAGIYFLDGRTHVAGHGSAAEHHLLLHGAILLARLRFDGELPEGRVVGRTVQLLDRREAMLRLVAAVATS